MTAHDVFNFLPPELLQALHWISGLLVFAEALNKLERSAPCAPGLAPRARTAAWLKALAWMLLAVGGAGAIVTPLMRLQPPTLQDVCVMLGFAVLIIRTRVKEG
ncbi:hypothetical protein [Polaromonas sp.]|uniref:hypothetical protein n=1 Tax=Polaromonas sp. TaxID=1869339 RepID=UPI003BB61132